VAGPLSQDLLGLAIRLAAGVDEPAPIELQLGDLLTVRRLTPTPCCSSSNTMRAADHL